MARSKFIIASPWGWNPMTRAFLSVLLLGFSTSLMISEGFPDSPPPIRSKLIVDPNTCPPAVLEALPRLGPVLAGRILAARVDSPFRSIEEIDARVKGIGPVTIAAIRPYLRITASSSDLTSQPGNQALLSRFHSIPR